MNVDVLGGIGKTNEIADVLEECRSLWENPEIADRAEQGLIDIRIALLLARRAQLKEATSRESRPESGRPERPATKRSGRKPKVEAGAESATPSLGEAALSVLARAKEPMRARAILDAVKADGWKPSDGASYDRVYVRLISALGYLRTKGVVISHGRFGGYTMKGNGK